MDSSEPAGVGVIVHPPLLPGMLPPPRPVWPTVIGIIAIVFGSLGALGGLWGIVAPFLLDLIPFPKARAGQPDPMAAMALMKTWRVWMVLLSVATTAVAVLLLCGGMTLLSRKLHSRGMLLTWAVMKMTLVVASSVMGYHMTQAQFAAMQQSGVNTGGMQAFINVMGMVGVALGLVWGWALPVFMLIWFARPRIARQVAEWNATSSA